MSIQQLLEPNNLNIYCNTINGSNPGTPAWNIYETSISDSTSTISLPSNYTGVLIDVVADISSLTVVMPQGVANGITYTFAMCSAPLTLYSVSSITMLKSANPNIAIPIYPTSMSASTPIGVTFISQNNSWFMI